MSIVVTGVTGHLGRLIVESLLERGVPASGITATGRSTERIADLAARGVTVKQADYADAASLDAAFAGAETLVLVSSSSFDDRPGQHRNAVDAAQRAGVGRIVYTSIANADTSTLILAADHQATEAHIVASGVPYTFLRNGWYTENYTAQLPTYLAHGVAGSAGEGRVSLASRADYAAAAAVVATGEGHEGTAYELGGPGVTLAEIAAIAAEATGKDIGYADLPLDTFSGVLVGAGLPEPVAAIYADADRGIKAGELLVDPAPLEALIGRPATPVAASFAAAAAAL